jgi:hypothetical protein
VLNKEMSNNENKNEKDDNDGHTDVRYNSDGFKRFFTGETD